MTLQVYKIKRGVDGPNLSSQNRSLELAGRLKVKREKFKVDLRSRFFINLSGISCQRRWWNRYN